MQMITVSFLYAWATLSGTTVEADFIGVSDSDIATIDAKYSNKPIAWGDPIIPAALKKTVFSYVTEEGTAELKPTQVVFKRGAGENHARVSLSGYSGKSKSGMIVTRKLAHNPKLVPILRGNAARAELTMVSKAFYAVAPKRKTLSKSARRAVPRKSLRKEHVTIVSARFQTDRRYVFVSIPLRTLKTDPITAGYMTAIGVLENGAVRWLNPPKVGLHNVEPEYTVDEDGDGKDELILSDYYYEGSYQVLAREKAGALDYQQLSGDGA